MKYTCSICGYVYDEAKEGTPFADLPDSWVCPLCGAAKGAFLPEEEKETPKAPVSPIEIDDDMKKLSAGELSALCSSLARGCEKQYKDEEAALFTQLADYFAGATPTIPDADIHSLAQLLQSDLKDGYPSLTSAAIAEADRGTRRICVWGEKVTNILSTLVQRWINEGEGFLKDTEIWVCSVCGFVYVGDRAPELCPVCKVPAWKFDKIERRSWK